MPVLKLSPRTRGTPDTGHHAAGAAGPIPAFAGASAAWAVRASVRRVEKHGKAKGHEHHVEKHANADGKTEVKPESKPEVKPLALAPAAK